MTHSTQTLLQWLRDDGFSPEVSGPGADGTGAATATSNDPAISSLCIDSRKATRGSLFAALPGHRSTATISLATRWRRARPA